MSTAQHDPHAVQRQLETRTTERGEVNVQAISHSYATSVADLWDAVTNAERLPRWFAPVNGDLELGGRYQVEGNAGGTIETCEPPHRFTATWEFNGQVSWIAVAIRSEREGSRLELEHTAVLDPDSEEQAAFWQTYGPGATGVGWDLSLMGLTRHVADPDAAVDPAAVEQWSTSQEGIAFLSACSQLWGEVAVAAGTPRERAEAAAARTTAFYTGQPDPTARQSQGD